MTQNLQKVNKSIWAIALIDPWSAFGKYKSLFASSFFAVDRPIFVPFLE